MQKGRPKQKFEYEYILKHLVLPRSLPAEYPKNQEELELRLLKQFVGNLENCSEWIPAATVRLFQCLRHIHENRTPENITKQINQLQSGESFAMFIRQQNIGLLIHMPQEQSNDYGIEDINIVTFSGNLNLGNIYNYASDFMITYPSQALKMKFSEMLRSEEFASQLCKLYNTLQTKNPKPDYVNTWLTTVLSDMDTTVANFPTITKKIRDEAIGMSEIQQSFIDPNITICKGNYFRRSSFYMVLKVFLQLSLTAGMGEEKGRFIYKLIMLNFMVEFYERSYSYCCFSNADLMRQYQAKMARRIEKLSLMKFGHIESNIYLEVVNKTKRTIFKIRDEIDNQFYGIHVKNEYFPKLKPLHQLNFRADIHQKIRYLRSYMENRKSFIEKKDINSTKLHIKNFKRHDIRHKEPPSLKSFDKCLEEIEHHLMLTDFENWILYRNCDFRKSRLNTKALLQCAQKCIQMPEKFHIGDPFGISKTTLIRLKLIAMIDHIATEKYPLLLEHHSGIDPAVFDVLVLPQSVDETIANELQNYFIQRNSNASYPGLIEHDTVVSSSFPVRFAMQSDEIQTMRREIHQKASERIAQKRCEWQMGRAKVERLRKIARTMLHTNNNNCQNHSDCQLCELQDEINHVKIEQYKYALPENEDEQNAIVYELRIPPEIAALRDGLHSITRFLNLNRFKNKGIFMDWIRAEQLENHHQPEFNFCRSINLGYMKEVPVDSLHVDNDFSYFVVLNCSDCLYNGHYWNIFPSINVEEIKKHCTLNLDPCYPYGISLDGESNNAFQIETQFLKRQLRNLQNHLQFELNGIDTLRADDQLRKLCAIIETETLSFDQHTALGSILQSIWKMRTISVAFIDSDITIAVIELLAKFIENQIDNWANPIQLLLITFITVRIYELNAIKSIADQLVNVLHKIRNVTIDWYEKIQQKINKLENPTLAKEQSLRLLLVTASITGAMTFFVNSKHHFFNNIFNTNLLDGCNGTAVRAWLLSIITLNRNILLEGQILTESTSILRMLVRLVRYTGIHVERKIREIIQKDPNVVIELIKEQWPPAIEAKFKEFNFSEKCPQVFIVYVEIEKITKHITIDVITGSLLVNNLPIGRLPDNITSNPLFRCHFGGSILEVQANSRNNFISTHKYNGISYEFGWIRCNELIIIEHGKDGFERELIENYYALSNDFPELMAKNYSHWWCKQKNLIEFRSKFFNSEPFSESPIIEFTFNVNTCRLIQNETNSFMLDMTSQSYKRIQDYAKRLEYFRYIHVFVKDNIVATVEMVRLGLKFIIDKSKPNSNGCYDLISNEFPGMKISSRSIGTLYGMNEGLLLESVYSENSQLMSKILLVPHGRISSTHEYPDLHSRVNIDIYCRMNPPFYRYHVDETMRQLKPCDGSPSAWIYLAYLHALTSHGETEPLTGMSGTERALQILQSNAVRSSTPYAPDVVTILKSIYNLSTERKLNGNSQSVFESGWPHPVPEHCSQDSFIFIVQELMKEAQCLNELHSFSTDVLAFKDRTYSELNRRSYLRCLPLQPNLRVDDAFIDHNNELQTNLPKIPPIFYSAYTRLISCLHHANAFAVPENFDLKKFFTISGKFDGLIHVENILYILDHNVYKSLIDMWLSLYEVARKQLLSREQFGLIFSLLSHENPSDEQFKAILALQAIARNPDQFMDCDPPPYDGYEISEGLFDPAKVSKILNSCFLKPADVNNDEIYFDDDRNKYEEKVTNHIEQITKFVVSHWPCNHIDLASAEFIKSTEILVTEANLKLNAKLRIWNHNRRLFDFIEKIENKLRKLRPLAVVMQPSDLNVSQSLTLKSHQKYEINFEKIMLENIETTTKTADESAKIWLENGNSNRSASEWWAIYKQSVYSEENAHLIYAGMIPRLIPSLVLPRITSETINSKLKEIIGALAITIAREQQHNRIKMLECQSELKLALEQEINHEPHVNWKPSEHPEWLLFEIDQNVSIRQDQIEIAKKMIDSSNTGEKNFGNQLDLDDRRMDVVVSILALSLAKGNQACEITVPESHFTTYLNSLRKNLSGMLNKRIYTIPKRHKKPTKDFIQELLKIYQACQREKGVILTIPESRLNAQLEIFNSIHKNEMNNLQFSSNILEWIDTNVRIILLGKSNSK